MSEALLGGGGAGYFQASLLGLCFRCRALTVYCVIMWLDGYSGSAEHGSQEVCWDDLGGMK